MERNFDLVNIEHHTPAESKLDTLDNSDLVTYKPSPRDFVNFDYHQYRRFDLGDIYIILGVFLVGFLFAMVLSNYYKVKREKIEQIN